MTAINKKTIGIGVLGLATLFGGRAAISRFSPASPSAPPALTPIQSLYGSHSVSPNMDDIAQARDEFLKNTANKFTFKKLAYYTIKNGSPAAMRQFESTVLQSSPGSDVMGSGIGVAMNWPGGPALQGDVPFNAPLLPSNSQTFNAQIEIAKFLIGRIEARGDAPPVPIRIIISVPSTLDTSGKYASYPTQPTPEAEQALTP